MPEYLARVSRRQHRAHLAHLEAQWNRPSRGDHYLMSLIAHLCCLPAWVWGKDADPKPAAFQLEFRREQEDVPPEPEPERDESEGLWADEEWLERDDDGDGDGPEEDDFFVLPDGTRLAYPKPLSRADVEKLEADRRKRDIDRSIHLAKAEGEL